MIQTMLKTQRAGVLAIDTNILVLLIVGTADRSLIKRLKVTEIFKDGDFELLEKFLSRFGQLVTTPQVLTEVNNLLGKGPNTFRLQTWVALATYISNAVEVVEPSFQLSTDKCFLTLGLADVSLLRLDASISVITDDAKLQNFLLTFGKDVVNFNHLRDMG